MQSNATPAKIIEVDISNIKINNRMRRTDENKVADIAQSIENVGCLLNPVTLVKKDNYYLCLAGHHRIESMKLLGKKSITANVVDCPDLVSELIIVEENLCRNELNSIEVAEHIIKREQLLTQLGKKATVGSNQYTKDKITIETLSAQLNISKRVYQYKKQVANLNPEVKDLLCETKFADNMMDMVRLSKESEVIQLEVARLLVSGKARTFRRAYVLANMKHKQDRWTDEVKEVKNDMDELPKSIMRWDRKNNELDEICKFVSHDEEAQVNKLTAQFGTNPIKNYAMLPEQSRWFVKYFSKKNDLVLDSMCGKGSNLIAAAYEGRRVIGYDLNAHNTQLIRTACLENTSIKEEDLTLHNTCGVDMVEYAEYTDLIDLALLDPPYPMGVEDYGTKDERDLCYIKTMDEYFNRIETALINLKRLIKPSNFDKKIFKPIIIKCGSYRRSNHGLTDMATEIELISRRLNMVVHDKIFNELHSAFQSLNLGRCIENRYTIKSHETNLILLKYED